MIRRRYQPPKITTEAMTSVVAARPSRGRQDEFTRRRRLAGGCCPTHGVGLTQVGVALESRWPVGDLLACPRKDCDFKIVKRLDGTFHHLRQP